MRPKHKRSLSPEVGRSGWGCFPAYNSKNELFLAKNDSPSYKTQKLTTLEHHRHGSGINYVAPVKVSLKNKRENKPNPIPPQVREDTQQCVSNHNSQLFIPGPKPLLSPQHSFSSSAYQVRPQTSHHPPIIHFITV